MKVLILENIRSAENTGSLLRTAEALGIDEVMLVGTTPAPIDRFGRTRKDIHKSALGAEAMPWKSYQTTKEAIECIKAKGFTLLVLEQDARAIDYRTGGVGDNFALVVGNEVEGVSLEARDSADTILEIPLKGKKESLNVAVATGIALAVIIR